MSLFQLTLILGGLLFREQEHREENTWIWGLRSKAVLKTASRFAVHEKRRAETCIRRYEQYESS